MPDEHDHGSGNPKEETYRHRGHEIKILDHGPAHTQLFIDGSEMDVEVTEHGVFSHDHMFQAFSSVHDLARALVAQLGTATVRRGYDLAMLRGHHEAHRGGGHEHGNGG